nr:MAG TPA: hypothetical protein [Caudoviricetes sp.]
MAAWPTGTGRKNRSSKACVHLSFKTTPPNNGTNQKKSESTPAPTGFSTITATATPVKETRRKSIRY